MSVYDIADHPDFRFRTTDIVIRIGNSDGATAKEDEVGSQHHYMAMLSPGVSLGTPERVSGFRLERAVALDPHGHPKLPSLLVLYYSILCCHECHITSPGLVEM